MKKLLLFKALILLAAITSAQVIHVPGDYSTIQEGIDAANKGDTVLVDTGTYVENINFRSKSIVLSSKYVYYRDSLFINNTIIDGSNPQYSDSAAVITLLNIEDTSAVICGFTIIGGSGNVITEPSIGEITHGGGISCNNSGVKIIHNKIKDNHISNINVAAGGGISTNQQEGNWVVIRDNIIEYNSVNADEFLSLGGGISVNGRAMVERNIFRHNYNLCLEGYAQGGAAYVEAALYSPDSVFFRNNTFTDNIVECNGEEGLGGGLMMFFGKPFITNNLFKDNISKGSGSVCYGAGVSFCRTSGEFLFSGNTLVGNSIQGNVTHVGAGFHLWLPYNSLSITDNEFIDNSAPLTGSGMGGGVCILDSDDKYLSIERNKFFNNKGVAGGGMFIRDAANASIANNLFAGNQSYRGGGINIYRDEAINNSSVGIINNTFFNNSAQDRGGGCRIYGNEGQTVVLLNNIFWQNVASAVPGSHCISNGLTTDSVKVFYNNIDETGIDGYWYGSDNINADPLFQPDDTLCHIAGGPCMDFGIEELLLGGITYLAPTTDYDGDPRPQGDYWDIGADECLMESIWNLKQDKSFNLTVSPNPSSGVVHLRYSIFDNRYSIIEVYSSDGVVVQSLPVGMQQAGEYSLDLDLSGLPDGIYFIRLQAGEMTETAKVILIK